MSGPRQYRQARKRNRSMSVADMPQHLRMQVEQKANVVTKRNPTSEKSAAEEKLLLDFRALKVREPEREYRFHPVRLWRFDFAWPDLKLACEVEGGTRSNGRHTRHAGYREDCVKYSSASILGWTLIRATSDMVWDGTAIELIEQALAALGVGRD